MTIAGFFKNFCLLLLTGMLICSLSGCKDDDSKKNTPLSTDNINLIFVVSADLSYHASGDINPDTANLTSQGLHRSLLMATYLKEQVLGTQNVTDIYALAPMTHLQTENNYPDMAAIGSIQQFALLNQFTFPLEGYTANSFPINAAYGKGSVPDGVWKPGDDNYCPDCRGLDFDDMEGNNIDLVTGIINEKTPGFYVFSAPWETTSALMENINQQKGYGLNIPRSYEGPNHVYVISIPPSGNTSLFTYNSNLVPSVTYPELPEPVVIAPCTNTQQPYLKTSRIGGVDGVVIPGNININQTIYIVRHAEAHPDPEHYFEIGNFVGAGQWRALDLPNALLGKINPNMVYSIDPSQWYSIGFRNVSYVRPSLTVLPFAIASNLPYFLVSSFSIQDPAQAQLTSDFFFTGGKFSNQTVLLAWESSRIKPIINSLLDSYGVKTLPRLPEKWPATDYDTIWTITLDEFGNLTVDNAMCEGIDSENLPVEAPQF
ncbi:MAG: hypothetical protein KKC20_09415 [Proteobacteria bacterium]|nr:hypothetical protein [Pseudomonadota bacterium]